MENCEICNGPLVYLGTLGNTNHFRCRNCGADHAETVEVTPDDDHREGRVE